MRRIAINLSNWINLYTEDRYGCGQPIEDVAPRETDRVFGRYFIA